MLLAVLSIVSATWAQSTGETGGSAAVVPPVTGGSAAVVPPVTGGSGSATGDTGLDPALDLDQDGDGYTPRQGDCDDTTVEASPAGTEVCWDQLDNDCSGLYDEGCDDSVHLASLRGGGGCTGGVGVAGTQAVLVLPLLVARRRRA